MILFSEKSNEEIRREILMDYRGLLRQYYQNIGGYSKEYETLVTPSLIAIVDRRYIQLGGRIEPLYEELRKKN